MDVPSEAWLSGPEMLRAMAHPLRLRILGSLRIDGSATSAILARRLGTDSGQTSHHLRYLARYGFVENDPDKGRGVRGRERWWRAAHEATHWSDTATGPEGAEIATAMDSATRRMWDDAVGAYWSQVSRNEWSPQWRSVAGGGDGVLRTTPERLEQLRSDIWNLIRDADTPDAGEGFETVFVVFQAYPYRTGAK